MNKCLGDPLGDHPGHPRGTPGIPRGSTGAPDPGGRVPATLFWGRTFRINRLKTPRLSAKNGVQELKELIHGSQSQSAAASGARQSGVRTASPNHPSSGAGDQDDVSSQANSLKNRGI